jgi:hypothetical protein
MSKIKRFTVTVFLIIILSGCCLNYLDYSQHIESPDGKYNYCLYIDNLGIGDPSFYVLKLDKSINPEKLKIKWSFKNGISNKDSEWIKNRQVLYNYDEAGLFTSNPKIEIIEKRFIVFSRGGYCFGLYDLKLEKDTFNTGSPWNDWFSQSGMTNDKCDREKEESAYRKWIETNLDNKIKDYIKKNK